MSVLTRILGDPNAREVKRLTGVVEQVAGHEAAIKKLSDKALKDQTAKFKERLEKGESLDDLLPEAFATVREAAQRTIGQRQFDVQLIGGAALHQGKIAEMKTGEGKTLVAVAPTYLNALDGKGVHVITVNDYLATLHGAWMGQIYHALGLSVGVITHDQAHVYDPEYVNDTHDDPRMKPMRPVSRQDAYRADVTYGTNNEYGFDYLRDNMVSDVSAMVQRDLHYAIVDEVDSILIDEARTPLIISAPAEESTDKYYQFATLATHLKDEEHYSVDEKLKAVTLNDDGIAAVEKMLGVENIYEAGRIDDVHHIEQSLKAQALFRRDRDYVVREGEIIIVDEFTGRLMPGRRWSEGLHQAIEAKEGLRIQQETMTLATITFQNYFRLYNKLAGMTGTAATEAEEFSKIYDLDVTTIPTHQPMVRNDMPDRIYKTEAGKFRAVASEVAEMHAKGQPVLIGTVSIEKNERLSELLSGLKIPHETLNAKNNETEAAIIARAGQKGSVVLATNIAGRGTDIMLGEGVSELGGLHVLGTERHESRRIDNQLRGRAGRQGDPGSTQFFVSLDDDLMRIFGSERIAGIMTSLGLDEDTPIENSIITKSIESAQKKVEGHNFDIRKQLVEYDDVMNKHRVAIYARRRKALENSDLRPEIHQFVTHEVAAAVKAHTDTRTGLVDNEKLYEAINGIMPIQGAVKKKLEGAHPAELVEIIEAEGAKQYAAKIKEYGDEGVRLLEKLVYLKVLDTLWIEHLEAMDSMRNGIGLRAIGQRDPLVEYKQEGYRMYKNLVAVLEGEIASSIYKATLVHEHTHEPIETALTKAAKGAGTNAGDDPLPKKAPQKTEKAIVNGKKVGRNDLCPCGSGLKYKKCGMINAPEHKA
jgi:preprotein translocase subunit SecA